MNVEEIKDDVVVLFLSMPHDQLEDFSAERMSGLLFDLQETFKARGLTPPLLWVGAELNIQALDVFSARDMYQALKERLKDDLVTQQLDKHAPTVG